MIPANVDAAFLADAMPRLSDAVLQKYMGHTVCVVRNLEPEEVLVLIGMALAYRGRHPAALDLKKKLSADRQRWCEGRRAELIRDLESEES